MFSCGELTVRTNRDPRLPYRSFYTNIPLVTLEADSHFSFSFLFFFFFCSHQQTIFIKFLKGAAPDFVTGIFQVLAELTKQLLYLQEVHIQMGKTDSTMSKEQL